MKKDGIGHFFLPLLLSAIFLLKTAAPAMAQERQLKIGVLATRGIEHCRRIWTPTADYLTGMIAGSTFIIVPLPHERVAASVREGEVDFILTNSSLYVELEEGYGVNRIATLKERRLGRAYSLYGSVVIARKDRSDLRTFRDLKGKSFMGVAEESLGGWLMARRELEEAGLVPARDFARLSFGRTHDEVVFAVRDGLTDAGSVRTGTLESLQAENKINLTDFYAFPRLHDPKTTTPYLCSTREYPDWPMAKIRQTPDELAEKVAVALLQMPIDSPAALAASCAGWTIPANYQPVMELMMALRVGPYKDLGKVTMGDILRNYGPWVVVAFLVFATHAAFTFLIMKLNRRLKAAHLSLLTEIELHRKADKELEQARQQAEAATLAKSRFLANMSHEIRTPMNGIIAATDLAMAETVSPEVERYLHIIQNSSYALLGIINDILDFSKIEAGQLELKKRVFRLDEMFDRVMEVFVNQAAEKGIEILVDIDQDTTRILFGDSLRLQQILNNLISNSLKFTPAGGIILISVVETAEREGLAEEQVMISFTVRDTGSGIDPAYMPYLFEPFTQGDSSSTRKHEGTGLGLSICKKFVTMMDGTIQAESILGQGSIISFTVRMVKAGSNLPSRYVFPSDIMGLHVLVVDDCADSRDIMAKMLHAFGFRVRTLSSGTEAVARLSGEEQEKDPIELVLMDGKMPGMDGLTASRIIRQELRLSLPIIIMTAFSREIHRLEAEKVGTNGFLTKPIFQSTLFDAIMDAFGKEGVHRGEAKKDFTTRASIYKKHLQGCRILVAEDNITNQQVAQAILGGAGIEVTIAANGEEAVAAVRQGRFDAVLMDIQMPKMDGYEATREIRQLPGCDVLPIIAMTAHAMKGDEEKCLEAGMDGYVAKPINQDRLFYTLWRRLLNRSRAALTKGCDPEVPSEEDRGQATRKVSEVGYDLPGIDVGAVLQATGLDWRTFQDILAGFHRDNRETLATLRQALERNDRQSLMYLAHSLKGSAGNIGAGELREAAGELEKNCSENKPAEAIEASCRELQQELTRLLTLFAEMTAPQEKSGEESGRSERFFVPALPPAGRDHLALLAVLAETLDRADPEEVRTKTAEVIERLSGRQALASLLKKLEEETSRYDYDQVKSTIHSLRISLGEFQ